jgi:hypothetical protein
VGELDTICYMQKNHPNVQANAEYATLAVNNLHILAETLQRLHYLMEEGETVGNMQDLIEESLSRIS